MIGLVLGGVGVYGIFNGIKMIISRRADVPTSNGASAHVEHHKGLPAQLWGFLYIAFGVVTILIALAVSVFRDSSTAWVERFFSNASGMGWFLIPAGGTILLFGIIRLISGNAPYSETKLVLFERVTGGIYFSLSGLAILRVGAWLVISPSSSRALFDYLFSLIEKLVTG